MPPRTAAALAVCTGAFATRAGPGQAGLVRGGRARPGAGSGGHGHGPVTGGHRHLACTIPGAAAFAGLAWLGGHCRHHLPGQIGPALLLALVFAGQPPERCR
jgi:hypothetical protein